MAVVNPTLVRAMQSEVSRSGADQDLGRRVEELERELQNKSRELNEAREQQIATAEILAAISNSPTNPYRVFDDIAASAASLCDASNALIVQLAGGGLRLIARQGPLPTVGPVGQFSLPMTRGSVIARAVIDSTMIHVADLQTETAEFPEGSDFARRLGHRSIIAVPLMRAGEAIGAVSLRRSEVRPFTDRQIALLKTFADQAVIAIENTRLFEEVRAQNRALTEAHAQVSSAFERETATSEILRVIGSSPTDVRPVFDTIARSSVNVCGALGCVVLVVDGDLIRVAATHGVRPERLERFHRDYPIPLSAETDTAQAICQRRIFHLADIENNPNATAADIEHARLASYRTRLMVPMVRRDRTLGLIAVTREDPTPFPAQVVELLKTFADQAVIAIENTRLFEAEQASKRELQESLEYQTATSEVLNVISRSVFDLQVVLDALVESATRLCNADHAWLFQREGDFFRLAAIHGTIADTEVRLREFFKVEKVPADRTSITGRTALEASVIHIPDVLADPEYTWTQAQKIGGYRAALGVPLLLKGSVIGVIFVGKAEPTPFPARQVELVTVFADQAVIAIENTRLFEEVQARTREVTEALEYQTATSEVLNVISRSKFDLQPVLDTIAATAARLCIADMATIRRQEADGYVSLATYGMTAGHEAYSRSLKHVPGRGSIVGRVLLEGRTVQIADVLADPDYRLNELQQRGNFRTILGVPLRRAGVDIGVIALMRRAVLPFSPKQIEIVETFADQAVIAIENTRLFEEVQAKTRELAKTVEDLEIASQHKSQFVANMSHELRTPLAAILGYAELMQEGFYEPLGQKSSDALTRILSNGKHLLGLINTVLDIAKIESGQFSLNLGEYAIETVVETVRAATESLTENKKLALKTDVAKRLPVGLGDEQRLTQVLLNLVGNAIKFTDTGEVRITATALNGHFTVAVTDTGPGIPAEELKRVFEQFHQIDNSNTKAKGGTGLGLAIAKQIVEMHGGRIWVESTLGKGATFQMQLPIRAEFRKATT